MTSLIGKGGGSKAELVEVRLGSTSSLCRIEGSSGLKDLRIKG